jgi:glycosyltransferase involved in cell wall biosynthesis
MNKISIIIPTFNCEETIETTMKSVEWADEIIIVDSFSTDNTLDIIKKYSVKIYQRKYINPVDQKNWILQHCNYRWIFQIDSDEHLNSGAEKIIRHTILQSNDRVHCFKMPRKNYVLGKWVKYGGLYPDYQIRLFNKSFCQWDSRLVHEKIKGPGEVGALDTYLLHDGMPHIKKQISNLDRYTRYEADELQKNNIQFSFIKWILGPLFIFLKRYIYLQGFRDGWRGFFLAIFSSFYIFVSHVKLLEIKLLQLDRSPK